MDFLSKTSIQVTELFRSMSPGARVITGLLLVIVVVSLSYLVIYQPTSPDEYLFGARPLTNAEIARATVAFSKANLSHWDAQGNRLCVPKGQKHFYLAALAENEAMPRAPFDFDQEAVRSSNVWTTKEQHAQGVKMAAERELSLIIRHMSGVEDAIVKYQETMEARFPRNIKKVTASVSVWPQVGFHFDENHVDSIRHVVANGIGTTPSLVEVVDMESGIRQSNHQNAGSSQAASQYQVAKKELETYFAHKSLEALNMIPDATVVVNVELDKTVVERTWSKVHDPQKAVTVASTSTTENQATNNRSISGEPGLVSQQGPNAATAVNDRAKERGSTTSKTVETTTKALSDEYVEQVKAGLIPVSATVAVSIPKSYYRKVWQQQNPPPAGQKPELPDENTINQFAESINNEIRSHVAHVLPFVPDDGTKVEPISVLAFEKLAVPEPERPPLTATAASWLSQNWSTTGMLALGLFSLIMLRGMIRSLPRPIEPDVQSTQASLESREQGMEHTQEAGDESEGDERVLQSSMRESGLREELADMVRENPDAAAKVVSSWIENAA